MHAPDDKADSNTCRDRALHGILLAAGGSRRLGRPKQLVQFRGRSLIEQAIAQLADAVGWARLCVVLGAGAEQVRPYVDPRVGAVVENPDWREGMSSSLRCGLGALPETAGAVLITLSDQPLVELRALLEAWRDSTGDAIVASRYAGAQAGVPAIFPRRLFGALARLSGEHGARELIRTADQRVITVDVPGTGFDIDRPDDLARLRQLEDQEQ